MLNKTAQMSTDSKSNTTLSAAGQIILSTLQANGQIPSTIGTTNIIQVASNAVNIASTIASTGVTQADVMDTLQFILNLLPATGLVHEALIIAEQLVPVLWTALVKLETEIVQECSKCKKSCVTNKLCCFASSPTS